MNTSMKGRMISSALLPIFLLLQALPVGYGAYCSYGYFQTKYCAYGCCRSEYSYSSDVCCADKFNAGIIAAIVIGSLAGLAALIGFIVCLCVAANNSSRRTGTVIQPPTTAVQTHIVSNAAFMHGQSTNFGPYGPVGYGYPLGVPPPAYAQNNMPQGSADQTFPPPLPPPPAAGAQY